MKKKIKIYQLKSVKIFKINNRILLIEFDSIEYSKISTIKRIFIFFFLLFSYHERIVVIKTHS